MTNEMILALVHSQFQNDDELAHYGKLGMHWGIRRYQPYGEGGYDPDHEGKNIGLAARLAGHTGSYSDAIKRGSSFGNRAKAAASSFGKRAEKAINEAADRANYAADRAAQGLRDAGNKARSGLAKYAGGKYDSDAARIYEGASAKDLAKGVFSRFSSDAKTKVSQLQRVSGDDIRSALGSGASRFQESIRRTAVGSKEFGKGAASAAALFGSAFSNRSSAQQQIADRYNAGSQAKSIGAFRKDYSGTAPGTTGHSVNALLGYGKKTERTWDPRAAMKTQMLQDLGAGKNLGKNRGALSRQGSYDSARQRDLIRSAGGSKSNGLYDIGDRINPISKETVHKAPKEFRNNRANINPNNHRTYGGDSSYDLNNGLRQARSILLQDMSVKDPYRKAFNARDLERAQSTVKSIFADLERREDIRTMKPGASVDPYIARSLGIIK